MEEIKEIIKEANKILINKIKIVIAKIIIKMKIKVKNNKVPQCIIIKIQINSKILIKQVNFRTMKAIIKFNLITTTTLTIVNDIEGAQKVQKIKKQS